MGAKAQNEFLVTVDPATGNYVHIHNIPGVNYIVTGPSYTCFDKNNHRFFFHGIDTGGVYHLYTINATNGTIIYNPLFPAIPDLGDNIIEMQYDNGTNTLYALHWDYSEEREYLVSIDPATGIHTHIDSIPALHWIVVDPGYTAFDETHGRFLLKGYDDFFNSYLYTIDVATGDVLSNIAFPVLADPGDMMFELQYDNSTDSLYALYWDYSDSTEYLVSVNPMTGSYIVLYPIPGVAATTSNPNYTTFDEVHHRYFFKGLDTNGYGRLYCINVVTGIVEYQPIFPIVPTPGDNVIELTCDNSTGTLYALNWEVKFVGVDANENADISVFPNPFSSETKIELGKEYKDIAVYIYNSGGAIVRKEVAKNTSSLSIQRENLAAGLYFVSLNCDHIMLGPIRLMVSD